jgi:flagellar biosynthesis/type III secretory pathway M-ring protein FliF/YscJ
MIFNYVLSLFLYFPEDKSEYWGAGLTLLIFIIAAIFVMRLIINYSKKEALKTKELEEKMLKQQKKEDSKNSL